MSWKDFSPPAAKPWRVSRGEPTAEPKISILVSDAHLPWAGHMGAYALPTLYEAIRRHGTTLIFVNTRAQAEIVFQELWRVNEETLPIALHHGSLSAEQRQKVEAAMSAGALRAVVATSSLDLGIDWASVDLVVQVGAPKGVSRLIQRIGRSNHRFDAPSEAILVPANRFEVLECRAALLAVAAHNLDGDPPRPGGLDVLAQHILTLACSAPIEADAVYEEVCSAAPYRDLERRDFDDILRFIENGGYALSAYDRWHRLFRDSEGRYHIRSDAVARRHRMNLGTIIEATTLKVRIGGNRRVPGASLGEVEEYFASTLSAGDTFLFAGELLRFEGIRDMNVIATRAVDPGPPKIPTYVGGRLPLSTYLSREVRALVSDPSQWHDLPPSVEEWLTLQLSRSTMPSADGLLVETFPRQGREYLVAYCFEGRNAHQTLGMLLTRRMERVGLRPLGFVATDYVLAVWSGRAATDLDALFDQDMLGDDLETWMAESAMLKRTFRNIAIIAGLIDRKLPGLEKTRKQVTFNTDLIYDVLRRHEPDHILLRATRADAAGGLTDVRRLADWLARIQGHIDHRRLTRVSPLAVPIVLEVGREQVHGSVDHLLEDAESLIAEAMSKLEPA